ncbi:MAG: GNAT family N-acetyltransferase [Merismopedia sp. SIO2A8]|nr:GNAT family N-acetyltransferase [Merismopedia sp. SIO2A8]
MVDKLIAGYSLHKGSSLDRALLVKTMQRTYKELYPHQAVDHLAHTVDQYLSNDTILWWVKTTAPLPYSSMPFVQASHIQAPVACLWLGDAVDQVEGDRHAYVFLLYVDPDHRRRGIGTALMERASRWAKERGDRKISLQVFSNNHPALAMYHHLGYQTQSFWMSKSLVDTD